MFLLQKYCPDYHTSLAWNLVSDQVSDFFVLGGVVCFGLEYEGGGFKSFYLGILVFKC